MYGPRERSAQEKGASGEIGCILILIWWAKECMLHQMTSSYLTNFVKLFLTMSMHSSSCPSVMTNGGVNRIVSPCVGFASKPFLAILNGAFGGLCLIRHNLELFQKIYHILQNYHHKLIMNSYINLTSTQMSQASKPSETTMALNSPLPRTVLTACDGSSDFNAALK